MPRLNQSHLSTIARRLFVLLASSFALGLVWYLILYGRYPLYVSHVNWIYNAGGDALQHYLGWAFFRAEPWSFPLGRIAAYGYPFGTSVTLMDAIPLLALPLRLLSPWLGTNFQYLGLWELVSLAGQMLFGLLIVGEFTRSLAIKALGASLLALSTPMIFRAFYHSGLSAHWIVLAGIWLCILAYRERLWRWAWLPLFAVAVLTQVYFVPMLAPLWLISEYFFYRRQPRRWRLALDLLSVTGVMALVAYALGFFQMGLGSLSDYGFGVWSWNLNGFYNPFDFVSAFLKAQPTGTGGQYEGLSYLGLGIMMLLPSALYLFIEKEQPRRRLGVIIPFAIAALVYMLVALSHEAYWNDFAMWLIPLPARVSAMLNLFRTGGRFILPVFYFVTLFAILIIARRARLATLVLAAALLLQYADLQPLIQSKRLGGFTAYDTPLKSEFWQAAAQSNHHLVVIPDRKLTRDTEPFAIYALNRHLTLNLGYFARSDAQAFKNYAQQTWVGLSAGQSDSETIYVITDPAWIEQVISSLPANLRVCAVDGFIVLFGHSNALSGQGAGSPPGCSTP